MFMLRKRFSPLHVEVLEARVLPAVELAVFLETGFATEAISSGMSKFQAEVELDPRLAGRVQVDVIPWQAQNGLPVSRNAQYFFARDYIMRRLVELGNPPHIEGGHSTGAHLANIHAAHFLQQRMPPIAFLSWEPWNPWDWRLNQSRQVYAPPGGLPGNRVLNFIVRGDPFLSLGVVGYTFQGAHNEDRITRGLDGRWGTFFRPSLDDPTHYSVDDDESPGGDGFFGTTDDVRLGTFVSARDFLFSQLIPPTGSVPPGDGLTEVMDLLPAPIESLFVTPLVSETGVVDAREVVMSTDWAVEQSTPNQTVTTLKVVIRALTPHLIGDPLIASLVSPMWPELVAL